MMKMTTSLTQVIILSVAAVTTAIHCVTHSFKGTIKFLRYLENKKYYNERMVIALSSPLL